MKNIFLSDEDNKLSNSIAGIVLVATIALMYFLLKPVDIAGYIISVACALVISGMVYFIVESIRKKST